MIKYVFTGESINFQGRELNRIRYVRSFGKIKKGDIGGWIEGEHNLSHDGLCAILDESKVFGNAQVKDNAIVKERSTIKDNAKIQGNAKIETSMIGADTVVMYHASVSYSEIEFFELINQERHGVLGNSKIIACSILATGFIYDSRIKNKHLKGTLNLVNVRRY